MDQLEQLAQKLITANTSRGQAAYKGRITKLLAEIAQEKGVQPTRSIVFNVASRYKLDYLMKRLQVQIFEENGSVWGWWDLHIQLMAEILPLEKSSEGYHVKYDDARKGFYKAVRLPVTFYKNRGLFGESPSTEVTIESNGAEWIKYGYAKACPLQFDMNLERNEYTVTRSIHDYGFWVAYKWWEGCQSWYENLHPEWFCDMAYWQPKDNRAVLGCENRDFWESRKIE